MPDLPVVRRTSCGHGVLPGTAQPNATDTAGNDMYLCAACRNSFTYNLETKLVRSARTETKDVRAEQQRIAGR